MLSCSECTHRREPICHKFGVRRRKPGLVGHRRRRIDSNTSARTRTCSLNTLGVSAWFPIGGRAGPMSKPQGMNYA